jgi:predicted ABC-class ATPase
MSIGSLVMTARRILRLSMEERRRPPDRNAAVNIMNKESVADKGWSSILRVESIVTTPQHKRQTCCGSVMHRVADCRMRNILVKGLRASPSSSIAISCGTKLRINGVQCPKRTSCRRYSNRISIETRRVLWQGRAHVTLSFVAARFSRCSAFTKKRDPWTAFRTADVRTTQCSKQYINTAGVA